MKIPDEYKGREQTYLKHRVLSEYVHAWAQKWASTSRGRAVRLWYVDCFAGPWQAQDEALEDTSVAIGLDALQQAATRWGQQVGLSAIFVEKDKRSFTRLVDFLEKRSGPVEVHALPGEFGHYIGKINELIQDDPAFLFVDPTGWKGVGMSNISPLARVQGRDVLINVMFNHINRFKNDARAFLREQMREFFGLSETDVPQGLAEDAMFSLYRKQLRQKCSVPFAADLVIPHATYNRTWFRLVMGGHHRAAVELFRDVERRICGAEAGGVRDEARHRGATQLGLDLQMNQPDLTYARLHDADLQLAPGDVLEMLAQKSPQAFEELWPQVLSERHITRVELGRKLWNLHTQKRLVIQNLEGRQRTTKDKNLLALPEQS